MNDPPQYLYRNPHRRRKHKKFNNETMSIISILRKTSPRERASFATVLTYNFQKKKFINLF